MQDENGTSDQSGELDQLRQHVRELKQLNHLHLVQMEMGNQAVVMVNLEGKITLCNHNAERLYGWPAADALGREIADLIALQDAAPWAELPPGEDWQGTGFARRKDGSSFKAAVKLVPVRDDRGELISAMVLAQDSEEPTAQSEETLAEKDRLLAAYHAMGQAILSSLDLEQVLDAIPQQILAAGIFRSLLVALVEEERHDVVVVRSVFSFAQGVFVPGSIFQANKRNVIGISYDLDDENVTAEVARTGQMQVIDGYDPKRFDPNVKPNAGDLVKVSYFFPVKRGERVLAVLATSSVPEIKEVMLRRIEMMQPLLDQMAIALEHARLYEEIRQTIDERTRAEEALRTREGFLQKIMTSSLNGIYIYDIEKMANIYIDRQYEKLLGWTLEELNALEGDEFVELFHPDDRAAIAVHMERVVGATDDEGVELEYRFRTRDGRWLWLLSRDTPFKRGEDGRVRQFIGSFLDITERKRMEEDIRRNQNLESLGLLAGGIAHDFNNVLTGVTACLSVLDLKLDVASAEYQMVEMAMAATDRAGELSRQLLTFAKGDAPVKETASIETLLRETAELSLRGAKTKAVYRFEEDLPSVSMDRGQIAQVIQNLVINADQAMPEGGALAISAENIDLAGRESSLLPAGPYVRVSVADQGIGMSDEVAAKVFDPYYSTKPAGHGLGLSIVHSIIYKHGGRIEVQSEIDAGTTFTFYLPAGQEQAPAAEETAATPSRGSGRILLMDDEELIHTAVVRMLQMLGYDVESVYDGQAALQAYRRASKEGEPFAAVIMDLTIPGAMGGAEAMEKLRELDPQARVLVASGYANDPIMAHYGEYGFAGAITKPIDIQQLAKALRGVL